MTRAKIKTKEDYSKNEAFQGFLDAYWGKKADTAMKEGCIGIDESRRLMDSLLKGK